jgi:DNA anti-recombination protein RmuC
MAILQDQLLRTEAMEKESDEIIRRATELISSARQQIQHVRNLQAARGVKVSPVRMAL